MRYYMDIQRLKDKYTDVFTIGEEIVIQVKLDGANCSFTYNPKTDKVEAFSRKTKLSETNTLRGFYDLIKRVDPDTIKLITENGRYIVYGEWLCHHAVSYPEEMYNKFYMFDVYDTEIDQYLPFPKAYAVYANLIILTGLKGLAADFMYVPILYTGPFEGWEKTMEYLKENPLNAEPVSEGIVIKSQDRLDNKFSGTPEYLKIVNEQFAEVHAPKAKKTLTPEELAAAEIEKEKVSSIATDNRIQKEFNKLIDEGIVPISYCEKDIGTIMKYLVKNVINDCIKEEPEIVAECPNFNKLCGGLVRQYVLSKI